MVATGIVLTAAHCLYETGEEGKPVGFYPPTSGQMQVVPANNVVNGQNTFPHGVWNVHATYVPSAYTSQPPATAKLYDWGLVLLEPDANGRYAGEYTGTYGATWGVQGITRNTRVYSMGYPATGIFRTPSYFFGENQFYCDSGLDGVYTESSVYWMQYECKMNGGSSGGPVFAFLGDSQTPSIVGVVNRGREVNQGTAQGYGETQFSLWFDSRFGEFWNSTIKVINGG